MPQDMRNETAKYEDGVPVLTLKIATAMQALASIFGANPSSTTADQYASTILATTATGTIPVGALAWSITAVSGTVTVSSQTIPVGSTVGGGGYLVLPLKTAISYDASGGSALVAYDTLG